MWLIRRVGASWLVVGALACGGDAESEALVQRQTAGGESMLSPSDTAASSSMPAQPAAATIACPWEIDDLLLKVNVAAAGRVDCGLTNGVFDDGLQQGLACMTSAQEQGLAAEFTVINCIDCWIADTFVKLPTGRSLLVFTEYDAYGDSARHSRVDACSELRFAEGELSCVQPMTLFACQGALSDVP